MKPCKTCPFSKAVEPGALGGSSVETYVGQANGPFFLPCHESTDYDDPNWKKDTAKPQCRGAAQFRANVGREFSNELLQTEERDDSEVFGSYPEFIAHHLKESLCNAVIMSRILPPDTHTDREIQIAADLGLIKISLAQ